MNLLIISTAELVAVKSTAVQYVRRTDSVSLISCISDGRTAFINFWFFQLSSSNTLTVLIRDVCMMVSASKLIIFVQRC